LQYNLLQGYGPDLAAAGRRFAHSFGSFSRKQAPLKKSLQTVVTTRVGILRMLSGVTAVRALRISLQQAGC